jgi:hypothetical protein
MKHLATLKKEREIFIKFFGAKYKLFYNSNIFLRDLQFAILRFFDTKNISLSYSEAENLALMFTSELESENELIRITSNSWRVNFMTSIEKNVKTEEPVVE